MQRRSRGTKRASPGAARPPLRGHEARVTEASCGRNTGTRHVGSHRKRHTGCHVGHERFDQAEVTEKHHTWVVTRAASRSASGRRHWEHHGGKCHVERRAGVMGSVAKGVAQAMGPRQAAGRHTKSLRWCYAARVMASVTWSFGRRHEKRHIVTRRASREASRCHGRASWEASRCHGERHRKRHTVIRRGSRHGKRHTVMMRPSWEVSHRHEAGVIGSVTRACNDARDWVVCLSAPESRYALARVNSGDRSVREDTNHAHAFLACAFVGHRVGDLARSRLQRTASSRTRCVCGCSCSASPWRTTPDCERLPPRDALACGTATPALACGAATPAALSLAELLSPAALSLAELLSPAALSLAELLSPAALSPAELLPCGALACGAATLRCSRLRSCYPCGALACGTATRAELLPLWCPRLPCPRLRCPCLRSSRPF
jgi:hypothetical protein